MATTRLYHVTDGQADHLVWARTPAQAIRHVARDQYTASVAEHGKLIELIRAGVQEQSDLAGEKGRSGEEEAADMEARPDEVDGGDHLPGEDPDDAFKPSPNDAPWG